MSKTQETPGSKTNSIEIFIDQDGQVVFSDLPLELKEVLDLLNQPEAEEILSWCELYPQSPKLPDPQG